MSLFFSMYAADVEEFYVKLEDYNIHSQSDATMTNIKVATIIKHRGFSSKPLVRESVEKISH